MTIRLWYPCLCVDDIERSLAFYVELLGLTVSADVGWYAELSPPDRPGEIVVAVVARGHDSVPAGGDTQRGGVLVSVVVDGLDDVLARVRPEHLAQACREEDFGQRHVMVRDPDGFLVDVIERIPPSASFKRALVAGRQRRR